jgi:hypothetical protein
VEDLALPPSAEGSAEIGERVARARRTQRERYAEVAEVGVNADVEGELLEAVALLDEAAQGLLEEVARRFHLSARGYHRGDPGGPHHRRPGGVRAGREAARGRGPQAIGWRSEDHQSGAYVLSPLGQDLIS